ncbi:MAG: TAXI family TRAP transporter solute-binding subunit [Thermodesulfobacteriota bacterium]
MKSVRNAAPILLLYAFIALVTISSCVSTQKNGQPQYVFYGGPYGGTFTVFSKGISHLAMRKGINLRDYSTKGSFENVRKVNSNKSALSIAYASHVYMAINGLLKNDIKKYQNLRVLGYFYGAPAQLFVKKDSGITSAYQLAGKRIGVGNVGSGAYYQAEIFFSELGIWDKLNRKYTSYNNATNAFLKNELDACWLFTAYPSSAVIMASYTTDINLLQTYDDGLKSNLFKNHPYFEKNIIPKNTYKGVLEETRTFQDSALWIAHKDVPEDIVYQLLKIVYSEKGINYLRELKKTAMMMQDNNGSFGITTPLHPGAIKYYSENQ